MINSKLEKNIKLGFGIVIFILGIISFIILPNKVGMQISVSGKLQNYMPKIIAVIIPIGLYGLGFLPFEYSFEKFFISNILFLPLYLFPFL